MTQPTETNTNTPPPTPEEVDAQIAAYNYAEELARTAKAAADAEKEKVIALVNAYGYVPAGAERSKKLSGRRNEATITRSTTVTVDEKQVSVLRDYLANIGIPEIFYRLFAPQIKHSLVEGARDVLKTLTLPRREAEKIASLFGRSFDVRPNSPSLKVKLIAAEKPARKPKGRKQAA